MSTSIIDRAAIVLQQIDAALALAEKATPGPWRHHKTGYAIHGFDEGFICKTEYADKDAAKHRQENAAFIAASRTLLPASLRCLKTAIGSLKAIYIAANNEADSEFALKILANICDQWEAGR
jgi:hypothetical protein